MSSWPTKMIESHGDYREEAWLEDQPHNKHTTYKNQSSLPQLPVPTVEETLERFLPTAFPLAESKEEADALERAVRAFPSQSKQLQERLLERANSVRHDSSWLQHWWNTLGYLQVRDSLCINVSYYFQFADDKTLNSSSGSSSNTHSIQIQRAAAILYAAGDFRNQVVSGSLPPETLGRKQIPLCMAAYKYMFHACRIPRLEQDSYRIYDPSVYKHAVVACKGRFYKIPLVDESTHEVVSVSALEDHLASILELATTADARSRAPGLGYLTGDNRDVWANARTALLEIPGMEKALEILESGCVLLNLDTDADLPGGKAPVSRAQVGKQLLFGSGNASNRWFDKSVQLVVCPNGKAGLIGEHSMMDGMPVVGLANHILHTPYAKAKKASHATIQTYGEVSEIFGNLELTRDVLDRIETSRSNFHEWTVGKHDLDVQTFWGYGASYMKKSGFSPDAYVQMAMQVATTRLFGKPVGTYEASQTRVFKHGRTETTRTVSPHSIAFVRALDNHKTPAQDKIALLSKACQSHAQYIGRAAKGMGVDRHFLGLSMLVKEGESAPDLYNDPVFVRSKRWRVSTSNLTHPRLDGWGYGEVVPDGVGLSYSVHGDRVVFGITALTENSWTERLSQYLEDALVEMKLVIEAANNNNKIDAPKTRSKL